MEGTLRQGAGAPGLKLIETMRLLGPGDVPRLDLHAARMARSAGALGWKFDLSKFHAVVRGFDPASGERLRMTLNQTGWIEGAQALLQETPRSWRLRLAAERLASGDVWLGVKSTNRAAYDRQRAALPEGTEELIFQNERGEVCDGTITTLFFDRGQGLRTPPLRSGLLPGVLRAELGCPEEVLLTKELSQVRLWVGNSLRGLIPAIWCV